MWKESVSCLTGAGALMTQSSSEHCVLPHGPALPRGHRGSYSALIASMFGVQAQAPSKRGFHRGLVSWGGGLHPAQESTSDPVQCVPRAQALARGKDREDMTPAPVAGFLSVAARLTWLKG